MVIVYTYLILCDVTANDVVMRHEAPKRVIVSPRVKPFQTYSRRWNYRAVLIYSTSLNLIKRLPTLIKLFCSDYTNNYFAKPNEMYSVLLTTKQYT